VAGLEDFDRYVGAGNRRGGLAGPVSRFEKVEQEAPADGVVIEGDDF
jgi:hypothetical protein